MRTIPGLGGEAVKLQTPTRGMSSATKRKHVTRDVVQNFTLPQDDETIVQVLDHSVNFVLPLPWLLLFYL